MSDATNWTEEYVLKHLLTTDSVTRPTSWKVGLFTSDPTETGAAGTEVSGTGYVRTAATFTVSESSGTWTAENSAAITFPPCTDPAGWGTITHVVVYAYDGTDQPAFYGAVTASKQIDQNDTFQISANNLTITLD